MTRWGLFLASIGCIMIIFSQTTKDSGVSKDKKNAKSSNKPAKKR